MGKLFCNQLENIEFMHLSIFYCIVYPGSLVSIYRSDENSSGLWRIQYLQYWCSYTVVTLSQHQETSRFRPLGVSVVVELTVAGPGLSPSRGYPSNSLWYNVWGHVYLSYKCQRLCSHRAEQTLRQRRLRYRLWIISLIVCGVIGVCLWYYIYRPCDRLVSCPGPNRLPSDPRVLLARISQASWLPLFTKCK